MNTEEIDRILKHTLADFRLSRGEKRVLSNRDQYAADDEQQLAYLRHRAFAVARDALIGPDAIAVVDWLEDVVKAIQPKADRSEPESEVFFSPSTKCAEKIANLLYFARQRVDICVFTITDDRISDAILDAHQRKLAIRVISDNEKAEDPGSDIGRLRRRGVPIRVDQSEFHMHHKFAVFDGTRTLTGSYNWTRSAARNNEENFIVTNDPNLARAFSGAFEQLWEKLS